MLVPYRHYVAFSFFSAHNGLRGYPLRGMDANYLLYAALRGPGLSPVMSGVLCTERPILTTTSPTMRSSGCDMGQLQKSRDLGLAAGNPART